MLLAPASNHPFSTARRRLSLGLHGEQGPERKYAPRRIEQQIAAVPNDAYRALLARTGPPGVPAVRSLSGEKRTFSCSIFEYAHLDICVQFADATLSFLRENVPENWADLCDSVTANSDLAAALTESLQVSIQRRMRFLGVRSRLFRRPVRNSGSLSEIYPVNSANAAFKMLDGASSFVRWSTPYNQNARAAAGAGQREETKQKRTR